MADLIRNQQRKLWIQRLFNLSKMMNRLPPIPKVQPIKAFGLLLRGAASWIDDITFQELETFLPTLGIQPKRYSYRGGETTYINTDTANQSLMQLTAHLDAYVQAQKDNPIFLMGHIYGGIIIANWICNRALDPRLLQRINKVFLFSAPIYITEHFIYVEHKKLGLLTLPLREYEVRPLLYLFPRIVNVICEEDALAFREETDLRDRIPAYPDLRPLTEVVIPADRFDSDTERGFYCHLSVCNQPESIQAVQDWAFQ